MEQEYCVIYGYNESEPGPFIIAVTKDQSMINGFREEHYHFCKGGEVLVDCFYDNLAPDYEIQYISGHYMTPVMITDFMRYLTAQCNQICMVLDILERDTEYLRFSDDEQDIVEEGFSFLRDHVQDMAYRMNMGNTYGSSNDIEDSVYASILNVPECLDRFLASYRPEANIY